MVFLNNNLEDFFCAIQGKRLILFGIGMFFKNHVQTLFSNDVLSTISYVVDNNNCGRITIGNKEIPILNPNNLKTEQDCVVLIVSDEYGWEMYQQLEEMCLPDSIMCYSLPLILAVTPGKEDEELKKKVFHNEGNQKIDKVIHSFWFSGEEKPEQYQRCINSWRKFCPDYEIHEWNMNNYNWRKNEFVFQAIQNKKWAFAADYARLDIINEFGGIYFDMDVELIASIDILLCEKAFFSFDANNDIDLATFGSIKGNELVKSILELYENVNVYDERGEFDVNYFCQPTFIRKKIKQAGIRLDGSLQEKDSMVFLPRQYLSPKDYLIYKDTVITEESLAIHQFNTSWKAKDFRIDRMEKNRRLLAKVKN